MISWAMERRAVAKAAMSILTMIAACGGRSAVPFDETVAADPDAGRDADGELDGDAEPDAGSADCGPSGPAGPVPINMCGADEQEIGLCASDVGPCLTDGDCVAVVPCCARVAVLAERVQSAKEHAICPDWARNSGCPGCEFGCDETRCIESRCELVELDCIH
jgi:hypothetical protein